MSKECELCVKRKTMYCPNSSECYSTEEKPFYQNRIMLLQENQQLKEELQKADSITQSCIFDGKEESEINFRKAINLIEQYKSVLDEIRQFIKDNEDYGLTLNFHGVEELYQILDKANNE